MLTDEEISDDMSESSRVADAASIVETEKGKQSQLARSTATSNTRIAKELKEDE